LWNWRLKSGADNPWWVSPSWSWIRESTANAFMFAMFVVSAVELVLIASRRTARPDFLRLSIYIGYLIVYLIAVALQLRGLTSLNPDYIGFPFNAAALLPLLAMIERRANSPPYFLILVSPVLFAILLIAYSAHPLPIAPFLTVLLASGALYLATAAPLSGTVAALLLPAFNATLIVVPSLYRYDHCHATRHLNIMMSSASQVGEQVVATPHMLHVWFGRSDNLKVPCFEGVSLEHLGFSFVSIGHAYFGAPNSVTDLNAVTREDFDKVAAERGRIALITATDASAFLEKARSVGYDIQIASMYSDKRTHVRFYFLTPVKVAEPATPPN